MGLSAVEDRWVATSVSIAMGLSMLGAVFIVGVYVAFKDLRCYASRLVVYMEVLDFLNAIAYMLPSSKEYCITQAVISSYFSLGSILMTAVIAYSLYASTLKQARNVEKHEGEYVALSLFLPLPAALLPLTTHSFGKGHGWCWIHLTRHDYWVPLMWRLVSFYVPLWIVILFNTFVYTRIIRTAKRNYSYTLAESSSADKVVKTLVWYPLILAGSFLPITIVRILEAVDPESDNFELMLVSGVVMGLNGIGNAIVYGFTPSVRYALLSWCCPQRRLSNRYSKTSSELR